jgi:hypothetical protein
MPVEQEAYLCRAPNALHTIGDAGDAVSKL